MIERLGGTPEAFPLSGEDWFVLNDDRVIEWRAIVRLLDSLHAQLAALLGNAAQSAPQRTTTADEQLELVLGITCHAVYHAGQIQLVKRLVEA